MSYPPNYHSTTTTNPFGASEWAHGNGSGRGPPSLLGVLPYASEPSRNLISFVFTYDRDLMNSAVLGPKGQQYYVVATDSRRHVTPTTIIQPSSSSQQHARIDWHHDHPTVEWTGVMSRRRTRDFLGLSQDMRYVLISWFGCAWASTDDHFQSTHHDYRAFTICMGASGQSSLCEIVSYFCLG